MKTKILLFNLAMIISCSTAWAQPTTYGVNAGIGGDVTNSYFGLEAGLNNTGNGVSNTFIGFQSGYSNNIGDSNTFLGRRSGFENISGGWNTFLGVHSGYNNTTGNNNTFLGHNSGFNNQTGSGNVFLGYHAGYNELGSNKLYIDNTNTSLPLIWGDFSTNALRFNGSVRITNISQNNGLTRVLVAENDGDVRWRDASSLGRSDEEIRDVVGAMVSGNTETLINVTYDDAANEFDFVVENDLSLYDNSISGFITNPDDADADPNNEIQTLNYDDITQMLSITGGNSVDLSSLSNGIGTDDQQLSLIGNSLQLEDGGAAIDLSGYLDNTDNQQLLLIGHDLQLEDGGAAINLSGYLDNTDNQQLTLVGHQLELEDGGTLDLSPYLDNTDAQTLNFDDATHILSITGGNDVDLSALAGGGGGGVPHDFPSYPESAGDGGGNSNAYFGHEAGLNNTGVWNTFIGNQSGYSNNNGSANTAIGNVALYFNTTGASNTATGASALAFNGTGSWNTAMGDHALFNNNGSYNTANGHQALFSNSIGSGNIATGYNALYNNSQGNNNVAVGRDALFLNTTGVQNTAIGYNSGPTAANLQNTTAIGNGAAVTASNEVVIGNAAVSSIGGAVNWSVISDGRFKKDLKEDIPGLEFITRLRPVSYDLDRTKLRSFIGKEETEENTSLSQRRSIGFVAQEVEQILNENSYTRIGVETPQNNEDHYSIRYAEFVVPLVKGMQEQQQIIEALQQRIEALENLIATTGTSLPKDGSYQTKSADIEGFLLYQNVPNPFDKTTTIKAMVPESVQEAKIIVYNLQGLELESYPINNRGNISVEISAGRFPSGMYLYTLIADGQVIDTKKMILTR